jgi:AraC-like DNA-binding protein
MQYANRFYGLFTDEFHWTFETDKNQKAIRMNAHVSVPPGVNPKFMNELLLLNPLRLLSWLVGEQLPVQKAYFSFPKPERGLEQHNYFFGRNIIYNSDRNALNFEISAMHRPIIRDWKDFSSFGRSWSKIFLMNPDSYPTMRKVRRKLLSYPIRDGFPNFQEIAESLNVSHQNLWRKLHLEGTSYQQIKTRLRHDMAVNLLGKPQLSINEISEEVGYADERHFYRMFKKWTGMSPGAYRELLRP